MARIPTHPVAVVVFVTVECGDSRDAIDAAEHMARQHLHDASGGTGQLVVQPRAHQRVVQLGQVMELGRAVDTGLISLTTSASAYPA